jgi:hypothetical protein
VRPARWWWRRDQRRLSARIDRNRLAADFKRVQGIPRCVGERRVARDRGKRVNRYAGGAQRKHERNRIVATDVRVDEQPQRAALRRWAPAPQPSGVSDLQTPNERPPHYGCRSFA